MKRAPKVKINLTLTPEAHAKLKTLAQDKGVSRASIVEMLIRQAFDKHHNRSSS